MTYAGADCIGDAIALVAHDDKSVRGELLGVDVFAIEEGAVDGIIIWQLAEQLIGLDIDNMYSSYAAHGGLNNLGVPCVDSARRAVDGIDAKPIGNTDDGAEIARVLDVVKKERQG